MNSRATQMLIEATRDFLRRYPPFDQMETAALDLLAARLKLAYFADGDIVVSPDDGIVRTFHIIQRGKILVRRQKELGSSGEAMTLGSGECFPIGAMIGQRACGNSYAAQGDVFCYQLGSEDFFELLSISPVFNHFCTQYIATLLSQSQQQLQTEFAQRAAEQQTMNSPLFALLKKPPVYVGVDVSIRETIEKMAESRVGSMVVTDAQKKPIGIFTQSDVMTRIVLPGTALDLPIAEVMSREPHTLPDSAHAYDAVLAMATHGIRHVLVVDAEERLQGVVSERDLFALQRVGLRQIRQEIEGAATMEALSQASADVRQLALNMMAQGVGAEQLTRFISTLNDTITRRVITQALIEHDLYGIEWAWLAFGSEGRDEQTFSTDQDNGIVFACPELVEREQLELRLIEFARDVNANLDRCGFPLCLGNIMASNPELCLTLEAWEEKFAHWIQAPTPEALLNASIFFDFRVLHGSARLGNRLRVHLLNLAGATPVFLRMMAQNALSVAPPLGRIRDFVTDLDPEYPGTIDLKKYGARLFVDAARIFALSCNTYNTNTAQRLKVSGQRLKINSEEIAALVDGFNFIQLLRLREQYKQLEQGESSHNRIDPDTLNELDRRILKESFRQARKLQQRLRLDYRL